jgi:class 3 adenylate cyclase
VETDGERKTVTALFADIKGSMELMEDLDPEEARAIVDPALKLMIDAVHRYGGYIVQSTGDGIFALFGAPIAHEDHPQRALFAALRLQEQLSRYSSQLREQGRMPLQARVGLNTGDVVVRSIETGEGHTEYTPIGHSTSLAARIQSLAPVGSIATTDTTRKLSEGYFTFKSLGPTVVKGVSEPIEIFEVTGLGPLRTHFQRAAARGLTKFVGRQREMEALKHAAEQAQAGRGQIVAVMADPGIGKSRLFYEFKATSQSGWMVLEAFSVSYGKASAYLPVLELLRTYFRITSDDDERSLREKVNGKVLTLDRELEDTLPYLLSLLGVDPDDQLAQMDPQVRRRRTLEAINRIMLRESLNQPLMVIFEDLHWIDGETQALLNLLVDAVANARILLLVNYRPEYRHEWGSRTHYTQLRLDPLARDSAEEMLSALLGNDKDLIALKRLIVERTDGTPFFMEEMVQSLFEEGLLHRNEVVTLARPISAIKVPPTVQAVLAARVDRLQPAEKELLQTLAVIGRQFTLTLVQLVTLKSSDALEQLLSQLQLREFIYEQPAAGDVEYIFKHALTQEVAYNSLLTERRRAVHEQTARAIEGLYAHQLEDHYSGLAHHYLRGNDAEKALRYAQLAAEQALSRAAYAEAASMLDAALKLLDKLPDGAERLRAELALRSIENMVTMVLYGASSEQRERAIRRMCELGERIGERDQFLRALSTLSGLYFTQGESARGLELAKRCLVRRDAFQDQGLLVDTLYNAGTLATGCGKLREAVSLLEQALAHARSRNRISQQWGLYDVGVIASSLAQALQLLGHADEAVKLAQEGLHCTRESRHMFSLGGVLTVGGGQLSLERRQPDIAGVHCEEAISLCEENGFAEWVPWGRFIRGWALFELGQAGQGLAEMDAGLAGFQRLGGVPRLQYLIAIRGAAIAKAGCTDDALAILNDTLEHIERTGEKRDQAEMLRLKGEVLLMCAPSATTDAEECFRDALEVARAQEAKWWELRATVSLARLLRDTNRRAEARKMLAEIYNWFTEGFELTDLKEARVLLEEFGVNALHQVRQR